jgi:hypothetical protein
MYGFLCAKNRWVVLLLTALLLIGYCSSGQLCASLSGAEQERAEEAIRQAGAILSAKGVDLHERSLAFANYRQAVMRLLPILKGNTVGEVESPWATSRRWECD